MINNTEDRSVGRNDFTDSVKTYYQDLKRFSPISKEKEKELMIKAKQGDIEARNEIVTSNLRFVFDIAKKYRGHGVDIADLISEGNKGILKAIDKFDITKDVKFFTYAVWWIRQHMMQAIEDKMNSDKNEVNFDDEFPAENQTIENISMSGDDDNFYYEGNDIEDIDMNESYESNEENNQKHFVVQKLLATLDERERVIIMKYFGLEKDDDGHNLEEISGEMDLSTERVRQLKVKAINTMRAEVFNIQEANFLFN
jgi:RNA polymerase primary sigma factor